MDRRIRPWINKKIIEYIGEEEATLVDFVCSKVGGGRMPEFQSSGIGLGSGFLEVLALNPGIRHLNGDTL